MSETGRNPPLPHYLLIFRRLVKAPSESPEDRFPSAPPARRTLAASVSGFVEIRGYPVPSSEPRPCSLPSAIRVAAGYTSIAPNPPCQLEDHTSGMSTPRDCRSSSRSRKAACAARAMRSGHFQRRFAESFTDHVVGQPSEHHVRRRPQRLPRLREASARLNAAGHPSGASRANRTCESRTQAPMIEEAVASFDAQRASWTASFSPSGIAYASPMFFACAAQSIPTMAMVVTTASAPTPPVALLPADLRIASQLTPR